MKVGIITFHNGSNYGAALQCFALQEAEKKIGNQVVIINYNNRFISKGLKRIRFDLSIIGLYYFFLDLIHFKSNGIKIAHFKEFFKKYYNLTPLMNANELKVYKEFFDIGISGSDQIWNPLLDKKVDDIYFLNFGNFAYKMSYASSFGNYKFDKEKQNILIKKYLLSYSKISTREKSKQLESLIGKTIQNVCDPTLLLNKEEWASRLDIRVQNNDYLLIYALSDFDNVINIARVISQKKHLNMIFIGQTIYKYNDLKFITDAGPKEFVTLFYNANYIVTNSFHGTVFSINFQKQFVSVKHPKSPERTLHILKAIHLDSRLVSPNTKDIRDMEQEEMLLAIRELENLRKESFKYLEKIS